VRIKDFLENELVDFASYSTLRAIASYIDGLKNAHRKVVFGVKKLNLKKEEKVLNLSAKIMDISNYLHGDISGSIITLAKNYTGSNNLPLLTREGNFGTRFLPEPSAIRYIFTQKEDYFDLIFRKDDEPTLIKQEFEGVEIEPKYYTPILPLLIINGSEGIATGFAQKILPRNLDEVIDYLECKLQGKECNHKLLPYFNGFNGEVREIGDNKFEITGKINKLSETKIEITEIPIGYSYKSYVKELNKLEEKGVIKRYFDYSDPKTDKFRFRVNVTTKFPKDYEKILDKLKLKKTITENYTCIDENNRVRIFNNIFEIFDSYIEIRLKHLKVKKELKLKELQEQIDFLRDRINFINAIIDKKVIIENKSKEEIISQAKKIGVKFIDEHIKMPLWNLTKEKIEELKTTIQNLEKEFDELNKKDEKQIWLDEINEFKKLYYKNSKDKASLKETKTKLGW